MSDTPKTMRPPAVPDAIRAVIVRRLRAERTRAGLSPESLGLESGLSRAVVRQIESGATAPALGTLCVLADRLGLHPADLLRERPGEDFEKTS